MLQPTHDNVLIVPPKPEEKTKSGIIVSTGSQDKEAPDRGRVLAVGPNVSEPAIKVGVEVLFRKYGSDELKDGDYTVLCVRETEILAVIEPDAC